MARYVITIPDWHPIRLNQLLGCHWATRGRLKRQDRNLIAAYAFAAGVPRATGRRCPDPDAFWKSLLDSLVASGRLVDDGPRWCELGTVTFRRADRRQTEIELVDLGDEQRVRG